MTCWNLRSKTCRLAVCCTVLQLIFSVAIGNESLISVKWTGLHPSSLAAVFFAYQSGSQESESPEEIPGESSNSEASPEYSKTGLRVSNRRRFRQRSIGEAVGPSQHEIAARMSLLSTRYLTRIRFEHQYRNGFGAPLLI